MSKGKIDKDVFMSLYNAGLRDVEIARKLNVVPSAVSFRRQQWGLENKHKRKNKEHKNVILKTLPKEECFTIVKFVFHLSRFWNIAKKRGIKPDIEMFFKKYREPL